MVIDTSAILAVFFGEPEAEAFTTAIASADMRLISAVSVLEAGIVVENRIGEIGGVELDRMLQRAAIEIAPFTAEQCEIARNAYRQFGKGRHPASLNFGDCATYALAKSSGEPLLYKGNDFARTDLIAV
jgi:ribonuclease VapC